MAELQVTANRQLGQYELRGQQNTAPDVTPTEWLFTDPVTWSSDDPYAQNQLAVHDSMLYRSLRPNNQTKAIFKGTIQNPIWTTLAYRTPYIEYFGNQFDDATVYDQSAVLPLRGTFQSRHLVDIIRQMGIIISSFSDLNSLTHYWRMTLHSQGTPEIVGDLKWDSTNNAFYITSKQAMRDAFDDQVYEILDNAAVTNQTPIFSLEVALPYRTIPSATIASNQITVSQEEQPTPQNINTNITGPAPTDDPIPSPTGNPIEGNVPKFGGEQPPSEPGRIVPGYPSDGTFMRAPCPSGTRSGPGGTCVRESGGGGGEVLRCNPDFDAGCITRPPPPPPCEETRTCPDIIGGGEVRNVDYLEQARILSDITRSVAERREAARLLGVPFNDADAGTFVRENRTTVGGLLGGAATALLPLTGIPIAAGGAVAGTTAANRGFGDLDANAEQALYQRTGLNRNQIFELANRLRRQQDAINRANCRSGTRFEGHDDPCAVDR